MRIGELFIALGFKVEGRQEFDEAERGLGRATVRAAALAVGINAINYAFLRMIGTATQAAFALTTFESTTDLSARRLQSLQQAGAKWGVTAGEIAEAVKSIQDASAAVTLGGGDVAPFTMLGAIPGEDPFAIIEKVRKISRTIRPELARIFTSQLGISDKMFAFLRNAAGDLNRRLIMTAKEQAGLTALNLSWNKLLFSVGAVANRFASAFAPALGLVVGLLNKAADYAARFVDWLERGSTGAQVMRFALILLAAALGVLGIVLAGLATTLGLATAAMAAFGLALAPVVAAFAGFALVAGGLAAALVYLFLLLEDFSTAASGGKSLYDWNDGILLTVKNVERLASVFEHVAALIDKIRSGPILPPIFGGIGAGNAAIFAGEFAAAQFAKSPAGTVTQTNHVRVSVDGAREPVETARAVAGSVSAAISDAAYQMPIPNH